MYKVHWIMLLQWQCVCAIYGQDWTLALTTNMCLSNHDTLHCGRDDFDGVHSYTCVIKQHIEYVIR